MKNVLKIFILLAINASSTMLFAQNKRASDSLKTADSLEYKITENQLIQQDQQKRVDSLIKIQLQKEFQQVAGDLSKTKELEEKLRSINVKDSIRKIELLQKISTLKKFTKGYPVFLFTDTLFYVYTKIGSFSAKDRALAIDMRLEKIYNDPYYHKDSFKILETETGFDIWYDNEILVLSVSNIDALWVGKENKKLSEEYLAKIKTAIAKEKKSNNLASWLKRIGLVMVIIIGLFLIIITINKIVDTLKNFLYKNKEKYIGDFAIRKIKLFTAEQLLVLIIRINNIVRIVLIFLIIYLSLPLLFSVFPETKAWTETLLNWILTPARSAISGVLGFLPNLFTIIVIYLIFKYSLKGVKYFVNEIEKDNIHISGFHSDWAQPTFNIVKFLLYAFMLVLIFPYLPGSDSTAFKGVSVFVGILFSLGSSSAIANIVAGLVLTYMRPFKIGDRIKIGEVTGDVIEKTMLVTRIRTIKNEDITLPNSTILSSSTINYSSNTRPADSGLIVHTTVTIGYDVPWKDTQKALIDAALKTEDILKTPEPFVLQTSLDDFYVSYQLNAYTKEANKQASIYSQLHQNIQDSFNEAGIEILSPHYSALRDGNMTTIPQNYLDKNYKAPSFTINQTKKED